MTTMYVYDRSANAPATVQGWPEHVHNYLDQFVWEVDAVCWDLDGRPRIIIDMVGGNRTWIPLRPVGKAPKDIAKIIHKYASAD
jgi:hypothetical protein